MTHASSESSPPVCAECGAPLQGEWCHTCGQRARSPIQPAPVLLRDLAHEFLDLDTRIVRSLRALLLRPGFLTLEYIDGRRTSWTTPLRLYLLTTLVYFVVAGLTDVSSFLFITGTDQEGSIVEWLPRVLAIVVPAFAWFDHILFGRRRLWAESLIFSLHLHAGWFLLATITAVGQPLLPTEPGAAWRAWQVAVAVPVGVSQLGIWVYAWLSLKRFHDRSAFGTTWRLFALVFLHAAATAVPLFVILQLLG